MSTEAEVPTPTTTEKGSAAVFDAENATTTNATATTAGVSGVKVENFSTLAARLLTADAGLVKNNKGLLEVRQAVVKAAQQYHTSRYSLGKALHAYKDFFMEERGWMIAAKEIGAVLQCGERTIRNIVADYERVATLPEAVIVVAEAKGLDLAERKHAPLIEAIKDGLEGEDTPTPLEARRLMGKVLQMRKGQAVKDALDKAEKLRWTVRIKIRTALNDVEQDAKLTELLAALEEEMHDVWGVTKPITVTIMPKPGILDITGKRVAA